MKKSTGIVFIVIMLMVCISSVLFYFAKKYYLQVNMLRLDPIGEGVYRQDQLNASSPSAGNTIKVIMFGDSRALGWTPPAMKEDKGRFAHVQWINRGIGNQTSAQIRLRFKQHVLQDMPDILIMQLCVNDLKMIPLFPQRKESIIQMCSDNLQWMVEQARANNIKIILTTVFPLGKVPLERQLFWSDEVEAALVRINEYLGSLQTEGVVLFDAYALLKQSDNERIRSEYSRDLLHLNTAGYQHLNRSLVDVMGKLIK